MVANELQEFYLIYEKMRRTLLQCKNRFETIKETNPEIALDQDIKLINDCLGIEDV